MRALSFCVILTVAVTPIVSAQPNKTFITSFDPNPQNMFQVDKGYMIWSIGKFVYVNNGLVKSDGSGRKNQIFMIDANTKKIVKEIEFEGPQGDIAITDHWVTSDQHILLTGEWRDYDAGGRMRMFLTELTADLETVWINYYPDLNDTYYYSEGVVEIPDSNKYLIYVAEGLGSPPHTAGEIRILKADSVGNIEWNNVLADTFTQTIGYGNIVPTGDGHFLVSTAVIGYYYHPVTGTYRYNTVLHKIDREANPLWSKTLNYAKYLEQAPFLTTLEGASGVYLWEKDTFTTDLSIAGNFTYMSGLDYAGNTIWTREWNGVGHLFVHAIQEARNGDILGMGFYAGTFSKGKGWLYRTTNTGEPIWERLYSDSLVRPWAPNLQFLDLCEMADGRIAATGIAIDTNAAGAFNANVVLLVVDANGCLEPGCSGQNQYVTPVIEPVFKLPDLAVLSVRPNPSDGPATVSLPESLVRRGVLYELRCFDKEGRLLRRLDWPAYLPSCTISDLNGAAGLYYLLLFDRNRPVASGKFMLNR